MPASDPSPRYRPPASHLETQVSYRLGVPLIYVKGELDHDSASKLREVVREETVETPKALVLDLSELSYMDSGGLALMFDVVTTFKEPRWLGVVGPNPGILRLFEITSLTERPGFKVFTDIRDVSRSLQPAE